MRARLFSRASISFFNSCPILLCVYFNFNRLRRQTHPPTTPKKKKNHLFFLSGSSRYGTGITIPVPVVGTVPGTVPDPTYDSTGTVVEEEIIEEEEDDSVVGYVFHRLLISSSFRF